MKRIYTTILLTFLISLTCSPQEKKRYFIKTIEKKHISPPQNTTTNQPSIHPKAQPYHIRKSKRVLNTDIAVQKLPRRGDTIQITFFDNQITNCIVQESLKTKVGQEELYLISGNTRHSETPNTTLILHNGKIRVEMDEQQTQRNYLLAYDQTADSYMAIETDIQQLQSHYSQLCQTKTKKHQEQQNTMTKDTAEEIIEFDYMLVFDKEGGRYAKKSGGIETFALAIVNSINKVFANSHINATFRLVKVLQIDYTTTSIDKGFSEILSNPLIRKVREENNIDIATMITETDGTTFGLAIPEAQPTNAYSIVTASSAISLYSAAHEVAHNFGCQHSRDQLGAPGNHAYAVGANNPPYHTVMSYGTGNTARVPIFSSPISTWKGVQLGSNTEDNVRKIKERMSFVAQFGDLLKPQYRLSKTEWKPDPKAQSTEIEIKTDSYYFIYSNQPWLTVTPQSGFDNNTIKLSVSKNSQPYERKGKITISQKKNKDDTTIPTIPDSYIDVLQLGESTNIHYHLAEEITVSTDQQTIHITAPNGTNVQIFTLMGKKIKEKEIQNYGRISITNINRGTYIVSLKNKQHKILNNIKICL